MNRDGHKTETNKKTKKPWTIVICELWCPMKDKSQITMNFPSESSLQKQMWMQEAFKCLPNPLPASGQFHSRSISCWVVKLICGNSWTASKWKAKWARLTWEGNTQQSDMFKCPSRMPASWEQLSPWWNQLSHEVCWAIVLGLNQAAQ